MKIFYIIPALFFLTSCGGGGGSPYTGSGSNEPVFHPPLN